MDQGSTGARLLKVFWEKMSWGWPSSSDKILDLALIIFIFLSHWYWNVFILLYDILLRFPAGCIHDECMNFLMWNDLGNGTIMFNISAKINTSLEQSDSVWTAMGLSDDQHMVLLMDQITKSALNRQNYSRLCCLKAKAIAQQARGWPIKPYMILFLN